MSDWWGRNPAILNRLAEQAENQTIVETETGQTRSDVATILDATPVNAVASVLSTNLTGANNDLTFTAKTKGVSGDSITIAYTDPGVPAVAEAVGVSGQAITVTLRATSSVAATLSTNLTGTNNDLDYTAVTAGSGGNSITIAYVNPGVETATESVSVSVKAITVTLRSVSSVLSTATQVKAAIDASAAAAALVTVANKAANDGTGAVIALTATALTGGSSTLSTATQVKAAIEANTAGNALVTIANKSANDGTGVVIALTATPLAGGVDGTVGNKKDCAMDTGFFYVCTADNTVAGANWVRVAIATF